MPELLAASALEQARRVRTRAISSEELVRTYLDRTDVLNPRVHAFVSVLRGAALREARRKDTLTRLGGTLPPFHGVPVGVKDLHLMRGTFSRMGSRAFRYLFSPVDDGLVKALRRAGFVIIGKLSTSELGAMPVVEPDIHPATRNPWGLDYSAGGSSGGSGASVAAGMIPIAPGSDGAGSVRIPASFNGLYGLKPSRGTMPNPYRGVDRQSNTTVGPLTRSVADAGALMDCLSGRELYLAAAQGKPPAGLKVRMALKSPLGETDPEIAAMVEGVARVLETLGHHVEPIEPIGGDLLEFLPIWQRMTANIPVLMDRYLQPVTRWLRAEGRKYTHEFAEGRQAELCARINSWFGDTDVLLTPTVPVLPPRVGAWRDLSPAEQFAAAAPLGAFTAAWNMSGQPAASFPAGRAKNGLPIGAQLVGRHDSEHTLLALSRQLEEVMPFTGLAGLA